MINRFMQLSKGVLRLTLLGYLVWLGFVFIFWGFWTIKEVTGNKLITWLIAIFGYWVALRLILWVYDGFIDKNSNA